MYCPTHGIVMKTKATLVEANGLCTVEILTCANGCVFECRTRTDFSWSITPISELFKSVKATKRGELQCSRHKKSMNFMTFEEVRGANSFPTGRKISILGCPSGCALVWDSFTGASDYIRTTDPITLQEITRKIVEAGSETGTVTSLDESDKKTDSFPGEA
jgi:hypothetical protein